MVKEFQKKKGKSLSEEKKNFFFPNEKVFAFSQNVFFVKNAISAEKNKLFFKNIILPN